MLAGCGGSSTPRASTPEPAPAATATATPAPVLVELIQQRPGALIDKITVRTDGSALFDRPSGGVGRVEREVLVDDVAMRELREGLSDVPERLPRGRGEPAANGATYIVRFGGRSVVARQGVEPDAMRGAIRVLAGLLVGDGVARVVDEDLGGVAGSTHAAEPRVVVFFQRQGAAGATLDTITVRSDGSAELQKRYGGAGGRFKELQLLRGQLAAPAPRPRRLPAGSTLTRGSPPPGGAAVPAPHRRQDA